MKKVYIALGAVLTFIIALKLHINIKFLPIPLAAALLYFYFPAWYNGLRGNVLQYGKNQGISSFHDIPALLQIVVVVLGAALALFIAVKLHIPVKFFIVVLVTAMLFLYFPVLHNYYQTHDPLPKQQESEQELTPAGQEIATVDNSDGESTLTQAFYLSLIIIPAFILTFELHIKYLMYPLAAATFYLYVPFLYLYGKKSALQYKQQGAPANYFAYLWFALWFVVTCFFSYMLSHLLADVISSFHWSFFRYLLYVFLLLMVIGLGVIVYLQWTSKKIDALGDITMNFETQGRLASFEILLSLLIIFLIKH